MKSLKLLFSSLCLLLLGGVQLSWSQGAKYVSEQESNAIENYVVEHLKVSKGTMRLLRDCLPIERPQNLSFSILLDKKGTVNDIMMIDSIDYTINEAFRTAIYLMPKEIVSTSSEKERLSTAFFTLTLRDIPLEVAREIEYFYHKNKLALVDLSDRELLRRMPEGFNAEDYTSVDGCSRAVWIVNSRASVLEITTSSYGK